VNMIQNINGFAPHAPNVNSLLLLHILLLHFTLLLHFLKITPPPPIVSNLTVGLPKVICTEGSAVCAQDSRELYGLVKRIGCASVQEAARKVALQRQPRLVNGRRARAARYTGGGDLELSVVEGEDGQRQRAALGINNACRIAVLVGNSVRVHQEGRHALPEDGRQGFLQRENLQRGDDRQALVTEWCLVRVRSAKVAEKALQRAFQRPANDGRAIGRNVADSHAQGRVIQSVVHTALDNLEGNKKTLFVCGNHRLARDDGEVLCRPGAIVVNGNG
jgi:hypothetical protein